jgi:hypothetical protein
MSASKVTKMTAHTREEDWAELEGEVKRGSAV